MADIVDVESRISREGRDSPRTAESRAQEHHRTTALTPPHRFDSHGDGASGQENVCADGSVDITCRDDVDRARA